MQDHQDQNPHVPIHRKSSQLPLTSPSPSLTLDVPEGSLFSISLIKMEGYPGDFPSYRTSPHRAFNRRAHHPHPLTFSTFSNRQPILPGFAQFPPGSSNVSLSIPMEHMLYPETVTPTQVNPYGHSRFNSPLPTAIPHVPGLGWPVHEAGIPYPRVQPPTLPESARDIEKVALPSEMPIGSSTHQLSPPTYGVVKISNIPYTITRQEIVQFFGRQARLISPAQGCAVHIIMDRSTAKTMDCYGEFETPTAAEETVDRINRVYETGRAPRLGNRHVDVEVSNQDTLLKDLFPRAKCVVWQDGMPCVGPNPDRFSTGYNGLISSEEIFCAIRHAEIPHRSPAAQKCPPRTYESTISTLYKFPWYATKLYTVHDRNQLFALANRQIQALVARMQRANTIGLDQRLLRELLCAGLNCPAFNERQKYTLCANAEDIGESIGFSAIAKWFPFDSLSRMPGTDDNVLACYANLISKGTTEDQGHSILPNNFPADSYELNSPYGRIWLEWPEEIAKNMSWEDATGHEMVRLSRLVLSGWTSNRREDMVRSGRVHVAPSSSAHENADQGNESIPALARSIENLSLAEHQPRAESFQTSLRHASMIPTYDGPPARNVNTAWDATNLHYPSSRARAGLPGHRITQSSPVNFLPRSRDI